MTRQYSHKRGKAHSIRPVYKLSPPWVTYTPEEVISLIIKMANEGLTPSQIGIKLRDEYGIPLQKQITGKTITEILRENNIIPKVPHDLDNLIKKAQRLKEHLKVHKKDGKNVRSLELVEARIHRLSRYYKEKGFLDKSWKYKAEIAQLE
ncbi:MAG: 30S ribosomal protein S15 [Nitrososphaeria archaeon]